MALTAAERARAYRDAHKDAIAARRKESRDADPEGMRIKRKAWRSKPTVVRNEILRRQFGITLDQYWEMLNAQGGQCAICRSSDPGGRWGTFVVDHCHTSGKVRGLLCNQCNLGLGHLGDTLEGLEKVLRYLKGEGNG